MSKDKKTEQMQWVKGPDGKLRPEPKEGVSGPLQIIGPNGKPTGITDNGKSMRNKQSEFEVIQKYHDRYSSKPSEDKIYFKDVPLQVPLTNKYIIGKEKDILGTEAVNYETIALTLYDPVTTKGLLAVLHQFKKPCEIDLDNIVDKAVKEFNLPEELYFRLEATINGEGGVDEENSRTPKLIKELEKYKIKIIGKDLKMHTGPKCVFLNCETGKVEVYHA